MDKNQVIGFSLLAVLLIGYIAYNQHSEKVFREQKTADSITTAKMHPHPVADTSKARTIAATDAVTDSARRSMPTAYNGTAQTVVLENKKLALEFSTKGGFPVSANIKGYKTYQQAPLYLFKGAGNQLSAILPINNGAVSTADLFYTPVMRDEPNGDKTIDFMADLGNGKKVDLIYTLPADDYMMRCSIHLTGLPTNSLALNWQTQGLHTEKDIVNERAGTQVYYRYKNGDHDYFTAKNDQRKSLTDGSPAWIGFRKQYFSSLIVVTDGLNKADVATTVKEGDSMVVAANTVIMEAPLKATNDEVVALKWYIGPNDYKILKSYNNDMEDMVPLGYGLMSFVKYINKYALIPVFYFLGGLVGNWGLVIMMMTILIRLVLSFFTYKSYLSAAKMRVLKPELDQLRAQYPDDQQKFGVEQMKLYKSAGVNPLGGCLPTLFQMPFLFAMYYLFPSFMEFRQQHFLWASDLSTYDSIANLPFTIPFYGDHISLFTLLMTASSLFLALYNRNMTPQDPNNPMMKYMPFVFPIILMGVFNKMAAALTFYYTFSNIISMTQQFLIQKFFINETAIHAKLQENKNKPAAPSKWAQRLEQIQKQQAERTKTPPRTIKK